jgi:hypothetical protein
MIVHGPDGRVWEISRRPEPARPLARLMPGSTWQVEARTEDEVRRWDGGTRREAAGLVDEVALALRTGSPGPSGELPPEQPAQRDSGS